MKTEQELQQRLAQLPDSIEPPRDLWPELAARLAQTPQQKVPELRIEKTTMKAGWWLAAAAAVLLTVWAPWQQLENEPLVAQLAPKSQQQLQVGESAAPFKVNAVASGDEHGMIRSRIGATSETQWRLSSEFEQQRALQLAQINQVPEIYQDWKQQLQIWKQATNLVLLALHYQPDEPGLLRQLSRLQQQELAYLQKVVQSDQT